ncbi:hypothetical protein FDECE_16485 [Fusarium decemcellulare]|nr:hypothetical protein FDECE_16485 [Fusarium decemcellulare]
MGETKTNPKNFQDETLFPATLVGLDRARSACRFQMIKIVNEIDDITKDPKLATDEDRYEPFQTPRVFKERLPTLEPVVPVPTVPLSHAMIEPSSHDQYPPLYEQYEELEPPEKTTLTQLVQDLPHLGREHDVFDLELNADMNEKIIVGIVEMGEEEGAESVDPRLAKLIFFTNRGDKMMAQSPANPKTKTNDRRTFTNFETMSHDGTMDN